MHATRSQIRHYIKGMLSEAVDVGGRVFVNRGNSPFLPEELPALCVQYAGEERVVISGTEYRATEYQRNSNWVIEATVEQDRTDADELNVNNSADDKLDFLEVQVERAFYDDWRLAKRLAGYDPNTSYEGLTFGYKITNTDSYDVETEGDRRVVALAMNVEIPYNTPGYLDKKLTDWNTYRASIIRVGSDKDTTDRVLLDAQGDMQNDTD